jgi:hypothetical protein
MLINLTSLKVPPIYEGILMRGTAAHKVLTHSRKLAAVVARHSNTTV